MRENAVMNIAHGSGAQFMAVSVIARELAAKYKRLVIFGMNRYFGDALAAELPNVTSADMSTIGALFSDIMHQSDKWDFFNDHPYNTNDFSMRRDNFYDAYRALVGLDRKNNWDENGTEDLPVLNTLPGELEQAAQQFAKDHPNFVMVQFSGGQNPLLMMGPDGNPIPRGEYNMEEMGLKRRYPLDKAEVIVKELIDRGYEVLQYRLSNEPTVQGCLNFDQENPQLFYHVLAKYCKGVICIDSSLMHLSIAKAPKVVVLWAQTDIRAFGYQKAINLTAMPGRIATCPLMGGLPDSPICDYVEPRDALDAFFKADIKPEDVTKTTE